jgi:hypothetical protein
MVLRECLCLEGIPGAGFATIRLGRRRNVANRIDGLHRCRHVIDRSTKPVIDRGTSTLQRLAPHSCGGRAN